MPECSFQASSQWSNLLPLLLLSMAVGGVELVVLPPLVADGDGAEEEKLLQRRLRATAHRTALPSWMGNTCLLP